MNDQDLDQTVVDTIKTLVKREAYKRSDSGKVFEQKYNHLTGTIEFELESARFLYESMKDDGLSMGMVEAEGYLRALLWMQETIKETEKYVGDD